MKNEFVTYKQALALKELGFNEPCIACYDDYETNELYIGFINRLPKTLKSTLAPLKQQAFRWFREKHDLYSYIKGMFPVFQYYIDYNPDKWDNYRQISYYSEMSYEEAEQACLDKLIEICKNK